MDDITLSGPRARDAIAPVLDAITKSGHAVRGKKIFVYAGDRRQSVTGVVVNRKVSAGQTRIHEVRERIIDISGRSRVFENDLASVRGQIIQIKSLCAAQGQSLECLADELLPAAGVDGPRSRQDETRPCPDPSRHTYAGG